MTFTCHVVVHDPQTGMSFRLVADPASNEQFGLSCTVTKGEQSGKAHVNQLGLSGDYIRALLMMGRDFDVPRVGIFVPVTGEEAPIIGRWQTGFEEAGLDAQLRGLGQRQGMKLMERASQEGLYSTQPAIGSFTRPKELLDARPITLVHRSFTR